MKALTPVQEKFILHWGEMGTRWGINRTVAQIHALLYITNEALPADEIVQLLDVARSNVSTSLRELQGWGIVRVVHKIGDRRDHFESMHDVWEMFRVIVEERRKREIEPTLAILRECHEQAVSESSDAFTRKRLGELLEFFEVCSGWYEQMRRIPTKAGIQLLKQGNRILKVLGVKEG
jgi:DNA-binding transcriptional regulator GbsR (MarR family)